MENVEDPISRIGEREWEIERARFIVLRFWNSELQIKAYYFITFIY